MNLDYERILEKSIISRPIIFVFCPPHPLKNKKKHLSIFTWEMIKTLTMHNNDTTSRYIGVRPTQWISPQCALVLCTKSVRITLHSVS
jgi:hypothetical protein